MLEKLSIIVFNKKQNTTHNFLISKLLILISMIFVCMLFVLSCLYLYSFNDYKNHIKNKSEFSALQLDVNDLIAYLLNNELINKEDLHKLNLLEKSDFIQSFSMPVDGYISQGIKVEDKHNGIDIASTFNANVYSTQNGLVVFSDYVEKYGDMIIIAHANNYYSIYAHLNKKLVHVREYVANKQIIGHVGESGNSDGPHLHFEIWNNHHIIDPRNLIEEYKEKDVSIR